MNTTEKSLLGLVAAAALVLSVRAVYGVASQPQTRQVGFSGGIVGGAYSGGAGSGYSGGMMGGAYPGGMMGKPAYPNWTTGGFGSMMGRMAQHMTGLWSPAGTNRGGALESVVAIAGDTFYPSSLTVSGGATVTWLNMDFVQHTVTSGSEGAGTGLFDSHLLGHMQGFSYTFTTPGVYQYYCDVHPNMVGSVVVLG